MIELKSQIEEMEIMLSNPRLFIRNYFDDLINKLDIQTIDFENKRNEITLKNSDISKENTEKIIKEVNDWGSAMVEQLEKAADEFLARITPDFKIDIDLTKKAADVIKSFKEEFINGQEGQSIEKLNDFEKRVGELSLQIKRVIMANQCFIIIEKKKFLGYEFLKNSLIDIDINKLEFAKEIFPIFRMNDRFYDKKGIELFNEIGIVKKNVLTREMLPLILCETKILYLFDKKPTTIASVNGLYNTVDIHLDSYYDISSIDPYAFNDLKNLKVLELTGNQLKQLKENTFFGLDKLNELYLSNNGMESIELNAFNGLKNLTFLDLSRNQLKQIKENTFFGLDKLNRLLLSYNKIESIEQCAFNGLKNLTVLYLSENQLKQLKQNTFFGLENLDCLYLYTNGIESIEPYDFNGLKNLTVLNLNGNQLKKLKENTFFGLDKLINLDLCNNRIESIELNAFNGLKNLTVLNLSVNQLKQIKENFFMGLDNLDELYLSRDEIESIKKCSFNDFKFRLSIYR